MTAKGEQWPDNGLGLRYHRRCTKMPVWQRFLRERWGRQLTAGLLIEFRFSDEMKVSMPPGLACRWSFRAWSCSSPSRSWGSSCRLVGILLFPVPYESTNTDRGHLHEQDGSPSRRRCQLWCRCRLCHPHHIRHPQIPFEKTPVSRWVIEHARWSNKASVLHHLLFVDKLVPSRYATR